ncbi:MAG: metallopeptidase family protein [Hyphomonas sp.]|uniref:metallopeptidase family protein n=1 Tax=Hyphomonas sp. TaxID=87 RepID=UPI00352883D1
MSTLRQTAPTADDILGLAEACLARLPPHMQAAASNVRLVVQDYADDALLDEFGIDDPLELSGLYSGVPLIDESVTQPSIETPLVFLFRMPILFEWAVRGDVTLEDLVAHVVIHEYGHHFGWSDEDMDRLLAEE